LTPLPTTLLLLLHGAVVADAAADVAAGAPSTEKHFLSPSRVFQPWSQQPVRWFGAFEIDAGFFYARPRFELGYGRPHSSWLGVEVNPIVTDKGIAAYAGLRIAQPYWHLRVGGRYWRPFYRTFLLPRESYTGEDIDLQEGPPSRFLTWESELGVNLPLGPGGFLLEAAGSYVTGVTPGYYVYEETLRVVANPPWIWRARAGYLWALADDALQFGPVVELVGVPRRDMVVLRVGGLVRIRLSGDLEARGTFVPAVVTPDTLGADGADTFLLGIRYRWATGP